MLGVAHAALAEKAVVSGPQLVSEYCETAVAVGMVNFVLVYSPCRYGKPRDGVQRSLGTTKRWGAQRINEEFPLPRLHCPLQKLEKPDRGDRKDFCVCGVCGRSRALRPDFFILQGAMQPQTGPSHDVALGLVGNGKDLQRTGELDRVISSERFMSKKV